MALAFVGSLEVKVEAQGTYTETRTFTSTTNDGEIDAYNATYLTARNALFGQWVSSSSAIVVGQKNLSTYDLYYVFRAYLFFDTSILPNNANITATILSCYIGVDTSDNDFNITIQNGQPTYPHSPLEAGDYYYGWYSGNGGSRNTSTISGIGYWNITFNSDGRSWVKKDDVTKLCLRSSRDINGTAPSTTLEQITLESAESGFSFAPKLYVTYEYEAYHYILYGAYYEDGTPATTKNVTVTLYSDFDTPQTYQLPNGTPSTAYHIYVEQQPNHFTWNISNLGYNQTRFYWLTDASFEEIYVTIPPTTSEYFLYNLFIYDFVGVSNGYLESQVYFGGSLKTVERQPLTVGNTSPFWLCWGHHYTFKLTCDKGTKTWENVIPASETTIALDLFPHDFTFEFDVLNVSLSVARINSTWVSVSYTDNKVETISGTVTIMHVNNYTYVTDVSLSNLTSTWTYDWYKAEEDVDYYVNVTAYINGQYYKWLRSVPAPTTTTNPWTTLEALFGIFPFPIEYLFGVIILLTCASVFITVSAHEGAILTVIIAAVLTIIGWLNISWSLISVAMALAIVYYVNESRKKDKMTGG